jgi:hypothetical protein
MGSVEAALELSLAPIARYLSRHRKRAVHPAL